MATILIKCGLQPQEKNGDNIDSTYRGIPDLHIKA